MDRRDIAGRSGRLSGIGVEVAFSVGGVRVGGCFGGSEGGFGLAAGVLFGGEAIGFRDAVAQDARAEAGEGIACLGGGEILRGAVGGLVVRVGVGDEANNLA